MNSPFGTFTATGTASIIVAAPLTSENPRRQEVLIQNTGASAIAVCSGAYTTLTFTNGVYVGPGESVKFTGNQAQEAIYAITEGSSVSGRWAQLN